VPVLRWMPGTPCNGQVYYLIAHAPDGVQWTMSKNFSGGVPSYMLYRGKKERVGPVFDDSKLAKAFAEEAYEQGTIHKR